MLCHGFANLIKTNTGRCLRPAEAGRSTRFDVQVYSYVIPTLMAAWSITRTEAGILGTSALLISAFGGWITGALRSVRPGEDVADFDPLVRVFTFLSGFTSNFTELLVCRGLQGLGFGGEWAAGSDGYSRYGTGLLLQRRTSGRCADSNGRRVSEHLNGDRRGDRAVLRSGPTCC